MFIPTHKHADGGLYQQLGPQKGKTSIFEDVWTDGHAYRNEEGMLFWTDNARWLNRFEEVAPPVISHHDLLDDEDEHLATFTFSTVDVADVRHLLVSCGFQRGTATAREFQEWMKRVLGALVEQVTLGLHIRDHDFPDLIGDVNAFHAKFGQEYTGKPRLLPDDLFDFRIKFHDEETHEYRDEQYKLKEAISRRDRRDIIHSLDLQLDALCDAVWVLLGTADLQFGRRAFIEAWRRVYKQNMLKVLATEDPDAQDSGREVKYDIRKPAGWLPPDHRDLISDNAIFDELFAEPVEETNGTAQDTGYSDTRLV